MRRLSLSSSIMKMVIPATKTEIKTSATANCANHAVSCSPRIYLSTRYMTGSMVKEKNIATPANIIRNAFCSSVMTASIDYDSLNIKEPVELPSIYIPELKNLVNGGVCLKISERNWLGSAGGIPPPTQYERFSVCVLVLECRGGS